MTPSLRASTSFALLLCAASFTACATQQVDAPRPEDAGVDAPKENPDVTDDAATDDVDATQPADDTPAPPPDLPPPPDGPPVMPTDVGGCAMGLAECGGSCRDLGTDPMHCGACGRVCAPGQACAMGACACPSGQTLCAGRCVDTGADPMHCGMCGRACPTSQTCSVGACTVSCASGTTLCNGQCRDLRADRDHCGVCARPCPAGHSCSAGACVPGVVRGPEFRLNWLGATGCRSAEHATVTGADRGGIAITNAQVFYTGQTTTGRFNLATLEGSAVGTRYDAMVSNLRTAVVYVFVDAMGMPLAAPGGTAVALRELDSTTGMLTTRSVPLSSPITMMGAPTGSTVGFFSGWDRVYVMANGRAYNIDLPAGTVLDLGSSELPARSACNAWAFWGVAEFSGGTASIAYVSDPATVSRRPLPMGPVTAVSQFASLSNMCGFTVAPAAQRWYFHHARSSQLGGTASSQETVGYCDASTSIAGTPCGPGTTSCGGVCRNLQADSQNCGACGMACGPTAACMMGRCVGAPNNYTRMMPPASSNFVDACTAPGRSTLLPGMDDAAVDVTMPFEFRFWGAPLAMGARATVTTNGTLYFGPRPALAPAPTTGSIPSTFSPNGVLAPFWRDLQTQADGVCVASVGASPERVFVVHWSNVRVYATPTSSLNFEVVLHERDAAIDFLYGTLTNAGGATVGIENMTGSTGLGGCPAGTSTCNVTSNYRIRFMPSM